MFIYNLNSMIIDNRQRKTMRSLRDTLKHRLLSVLDVFPDIKAWYTKNSKDIATWFCADSNDSYRVSFVTLVKPPEAECLVEVAELPFADVFITATDEKAAPGYCLIRDINGASAYYYYDRADAELLLPTPVPDVKYVTRCEAYYRVMGYYSDLTVNIEEYRRKLNEQFGRSDLVDDNLKEMCRDRDAAKDVMDTVFEGVSDVYMAKDNNVMPVSRYLSPVWLPSVQKDGSLLWHRSEAVCIPQLHTYPSDWTVGNVLNTYPRTHHGKDVVCRTTWKGEDSLYLFPFEGRICSDCGNLYRIATSEKNRYRDRGLALPTRCRHCMRKRASQRM